MSERKVPEQGEHDGIMRLFKPGDKVLVGYRGHYSSPGVIKAIHENGCGYGRCKNAPCIQVKQDKHSSTTNHKPMEMIPDRRPD